MQHFTIREATDEMLAKEEARLCSDIRTESERAEIDRLHAKLKPIRTEMGRRLVEDFTNARKIVIRSAVLHEPAAWIVSTTGGRTGHERNAWIANCKWLAAQGFMYANGHGDWTLTTKGEMAREALK